MSFYCTSIIKMYTCFSISRLLYSILAISVATQCGVSGIAYEIKNFTANKTCCKVHGH